MDVLEQEIPAESGETMVIPVGFQPQCPAGDSSHGLGTLSCNSVAVPVVGRYRNDPYRAAVLPHLFHPQPPSSSPSTASSSASVSPPAPRANQLLPPVHTHHHHAPLMTAHVASGGSSSYHRGGFASRIKDDVARASAAFTAITRESSGDADKAHSPLVEDLTTFAYVRFKHESCCYRLSTSSASGVRSGDYVVVDADRGINVGMVERVSMDPPSYPVHSSVVRFAAHNEVMCLTCLRLEEREVLDYVQDMVAAFGLEMEVVDVEFQFDRRKLTVYFSSDGGGVDFRRLQRALFKQYGCRIWLVLWRDRQHHPRQGRAPRSSLLAPVGTEEHLGFVATAATPPTTTPASVGRRALLAPPPIIGA